MRELKFRAWSTINEPKMILLKSGSLDDLRESKEWKVMQYTGLKDKNGVEVYEGDIIKTNDYPFVSEGNHNYSAVIEYLEDPDFLCWFYDIFPISDRVRGAAVGGMLSELSGRQLEVIGNIYENPYHSYWRIK